MTKFKKGAAAVVTAVFLGAGVFGGILAFSHNQQSVPASAATEIGGTSASVAQYLDITDGTLNGFQTGVELPENIILTIPENVTVVAEGAFDACWQIVKVSLPNTLVEIQTNAFRECRRLVEVYDGSDVELIQQEDVSSSNNGGIARYALNLYGNSHLTLSSGTTLEEVSGGYLFCTGTLNDKNTYLIGASGNDRDLVLPVYTAGGTSKEYSVYQYAFSQTDVLSLSVEAGAQINEIGRLAFYECASLASVSLEVSNGGYVKAIGYSAFTRNTALTALTLPDTLQTIDQYAFNGCANLGGSITVAASVTSIGANAFGGCEKLENVVFEQSEEAGAALTINRGAFNGCAALTVLILPEQLTSIYPQAFTDCANLSTVYFSAQVEFEAASNDEKQYFGRNTLVIFPDYAAYASAVAEGSNAQGHAAEMTYLVSVTFTDFGAATEGEGYTLERLAGRAFNFVKTPATGAWGAFTADAGDLIPTQLGYQTSVWYDNQLLSGSAVDASALTQLLADVLVSGTNEIALYAKYLAKPELIAKTGLVYSEDKTYSVSALSDFVTGEIPAADASFLSLEIVNASNEVQNSGAKNAGTYSLVAAIGDSQKYGEWDEKFSVSFTIDRKAIDIATLISWRLSDGTESGTAMIGGNLYVYKSDTSDDLKYYFVNPKTAPAGYSYYSILNVENSIVPYKGAEISVKVAQAQNSLGADYFTAEYENIVFEATSEAAGVNKGTAEGKYDAKVMLTANGNYLFRNLGASTNEARGVTIRISRDRDVAVVSKTWYIVNVGNQLVNSDGSIYEIAGWMYNAESAVLPDAPKILHIASENDGAATYESTQFKVNKDGVDLGTFSYSQFDYVVNASMPAGTYVLTFTIPYVRISATEEYMPISESVQFTVSAAAFLSAWEQDAKTKLSAFDPVEYSGGIQLPTEANTSLTVWSASVTGAFNPTRSGYWADPDQAEYYSDKFVLEYNFNEAQDGEYYTYNELSGLNGASYLPVQPGTYTVYYCLTAKNYEPLVNIQNETARRNYGVNVVIYRVLTVPEISSLTYTGSRVLPIVAESELYSVGFDKAAGSYIHAGDNHTVTLTVNDPVHYKWKEGNGYSNNASVAVKFTILRADNVDNVALSLPQWTYGNFEVELHRPIWGTVFTDELVYTLTSETNPADVYTFGDATKGFEKAPIGAYTFTAIAKGYVEGDASTANYDWNRLVRTGRVIIGKGVNSWAVTPNVMQWEFGGYVKDVNLILAQARIEDANNPVLFTVTYDKEGENPVEGLESFTATAAGIVPDEVAAVLATLRARSYYLWSVVEETNMYTGLSTDAAFEFKVTSATNYWEEAPTIATWIVGNYDEKQNTISSRSHFGSMVTYVITVAGDEENVVYNSANGINNLADAKVGVYQLKATVAGTDDYAELVYTVTFRIFEKVGLPWWAVLIIVIGALAVVALIMFILHKRGVLQVLTGKLVLAIRSRATVDATIAAVRANKIAEESKRAAAEAEAREAAEARRRAIEEAKLRPLNMRAEVLEELAREEAERAGKIQKRADTMLMTAEKMRAKAAKMSKASVDDEAEIPEEDSDGSEEQ